jgi:hypothetical protein
MSQELLALQTSKSLIAASVATVANVTSLSMQLNQPYEYMSLYLPYWVFLVACIMLSLLGGVLALQVDYIKELKGSQFSKFFISVVAGLSCTFLIVPMFIGDSRPSVLLLMATSLACSLAGMVLLSIVFDIITNPKLRNSIIDLVVEKLADIISFFTGFFGGKK